MGTMTEVKRLEEITEFHDDLDANASSLMVSGMSLI